MKIDNTLSPRAGGFDLKSMMFKMCCSNKFMRISIAVAFSWMEQDSAHDKPTLVEIMIWCRRAQAITWTNVSRKVHDAIWHL